MGSVAAAAKLVDKLIKAKRAGGYRAVPLTCR